MSKVLSFEHDTGELGLAAVCLKRSRSRMGISKASGGWEGTLKAGKGTMTPAHAQAIPFSLATRFEGQPGSNPEEVIGAALSGCFSMALSLGLEQGGGKPLSIKTSAEVTLDKDGPGFAIKKIALTTEVKVEGLDAAKVEAIAQETKKQCPVSKALAAVPSITLDVKVG
jgi:osmotically inducible protein OsmC